MVQDRLSELPEPLIHHIFSFLPNTYIIRMRRLSKRWRRMWASTPFLYFTNSNGFPLNKMTINQNMRVFNLYKRIPHWFMTSFKLEFYRYCGYQNGVLVAGQVEEWLRYAIQSKVKELDLLLEHYSLPQFVLCASSLTSLKLREVYLEDLSLSSFPSLKVLSLENVKFDRKSLQNVISGCPIIESLHVSGRTFSDHVDFSVSGTLKYLSLGSLKFTDLWLECLIEGLPLLQSLNLYRIESMSISIYSPSLKSLSIYVLISTEIAIKTPNLVFLSLCCFPESIVSIEASVLFEFNLSCRRKLGEEPSGFHINVHLLSKLVGLKKMILKSCQEQVCILFSFFL